MGFAQRVADRVVFMDRGQIIDDCSKDAFFGESTGRSDRASQFLSKILRH